MRGASLVGGNELRRRLLATPAAQAAEDASLVGGSDLRCRLLATAAAPHAAEDAEGCRHSGKGPIRVKGLGGSLAAGVLWSCRQQERLGGC